MAAVTRIERDRFGELPVPATALYGIHTARALQNLSFSGRRLEHYPAYVRALALVKKAAAQANRTAGVLDARRSDAIVHACDAVVRGEHADQFPVDMLGGGGGIGVNMNVNEVIANLANQSLGQLLGAYEPIHPKTHVNASQSTADVCHSAARLAILEQWDLLQPALQDCGAALRHTATALAPVMTLARTCLQDALAVSLGALFGGYAALLERRAGEVFRAVLGVRRINLGGTVIGSGDGAPQKYRELIIATLSEVSGRPLWRRDNLYDAAQNIDDLAALSAQLGLLAEALIKIAQDLRLLASGPDGGFGEITLPAVQEGSSFFAGKTNPVIPETVLQCSFQVLACDRAVQIAAARGELNLNVFEGVAAMNLFDAMTMLTRVLPTFTERCLRGIVANEERCRALAERARGG